MSADAALTITAPAKINVGLDILRRRPDRFHDIDTVMVPISLMDRLQIGRSDLIRFSSSDPDLPLNADNLVIRALRLFEQCSGITTSLNIHLEKNIPAGAGLGGGSSDAASLLAGVNLLYGEPLSRDELVELAEELGSDIPFFLCNAPCRATGRGEQLAVVGFPHLHGIVVYPGFPISTQTAYRSVDLSLTSVSRFNSLKGFEKSGTGLTEWPNKISNDFEPTLFRIYPELERIKQLLQECGAGYASLSGSGSALYALYESPVERDEALQQLPLELSVFSVETVLTGSSCYQG